MNRFPREFHGEYYGRNAVRDTVLSAQDDFRRAAVTTLYAPHHLIFAEGNLATGLYLVCVGEVKLFHSDAFGRQHVLEIAGPGAVLGELALDAAQPLSISAETLTPTRLAFLPRQRLNVLLGQHPGTALFLIDALSRGLARARRKVRDLALKSAEARLAGLLLHLAKTTNGRDPAMPLHLPYTRREIAELIGVSTETAIRLLAKLRADGVIAIQRRHVALTDLERLSQLASDDEFG